MELISTSSTVITYMHMHIQQYCVESRSLIKHRSPTVNMGVEHMLRSVMVYRRMVGIDQFSEALSLFFFFWGGGGLTVCTMERLWVSTAHRSGCSWRQPGEKLVQVWLSSITLAGVIGVLSLPARYEFQSWSYIHEGVNRVHKVSTKTCKEGSYILKSMNSGKWEPGSDREVLGQTTLWPPSLSRWLWLWVNSFMVGIGYVTLVPGIYWLNSTISTSFD